MKGGGDPPLILLPDFERSCPLHVQQTLPFPMQLTLWFRILKKVPLFQGDFSILF